MMKLWKLLITIYFICVMLLFFGPGTILVNRPELVGGVPILLIWFWIGFALLWLGMLYLERDWILRRRRKEG